MTTRTSSGRATVALALAASLGLIAALSVVRYLPTHDGPQHVYLAHLDNHFSDQGAIYADYYTPTTALSSKGFALLYGPLAELFAWRSALQITLGLIILVWAWGALALTNAVSPERRVLGLVGFAVAFQWSLYMGFFSFVLATGIGLFVLAVAFGSAEWRGKRRLAIGALLFAQAVCHVFAAELVGLALVVLVLFRHFKRPGWQRELGWLAVMGIPTGVIAAHAAGLIGSSVALPDFQPQALWPPIGERISLLAGAFAAGPWWRAWPPVVLAVIGVVFGVRRARARLTTPEERTLLVMSVLCGVAALALPLHSRQWEFMSVRFIPMAVMFGIALVPVETFERRTSHALHGALVVVTVASIAWAGWHNKQLERACGPALAGLDADIKRRGTRLPIILDTGCNALSETKAFALPHVEPLLNVGPLYAVQQGGVVPYAFAGIPQLHGFVLTRGGYKRFHVIPERKQLWGGLVYSDPIQQAALRQGLLTTLASAGAAYEDVIFYGRPQDRAQISARGFTTDFEQGNLWIGHYRGCPMKIELELPEERTAAVLVEYGWQPLPERAGFEIVPSLARTEGGVIVVDWKSAPCGPVWVRAGTANDTPTGNWRPEDGRCEGAGDDGRLTLQRTPESGSARCVLRAR